MIVIFEGKRAARFLILDTHAEFLYNKKFTSERRLIASLRLPTKNG
jgi:hypothetical protein